MKQKLFNWIHRVLRKWGVKSTEYVNLNDLFEEAEKIAPGSDYIDVSVSLKRHVYNGGISKHTEFSFYTPLSNHHKSANPYEALESFRRFYRTYDSGSTEVKEVTV